jgi:hypothetical protein
MTKSFSPLLWGVVVALSVAGCRGCDTQTTNRSPGEPRLLVEQGGVNVESSTLDFGAVPMGKRVTGVIQVSNVGGSPLEIKSWTRLGSTPAVVLGTSLVEPNPVFGIEYDPTVTVAVGETIALPVFFEPPTQAELQVDHEVKLTFTTGNSTREALEFTLKGRGIKGECELPDRIDFGAVARNESFRQGVTLKNPRPLAALPRVDSIMMSQGGASVFAFTPDAPQGEFTLPANREKDVGILFTPTEIRDYFATVRIRPAEGCAEQTIRLVGTGVDQVLRFEPSTIDFGYVQPGLSVTREVTFINQSFSEVVVANLGARESTFRVAAADPGSTTRITIPKAVRNPMTTALEPGSAKVTLSFNPTVIGPRTGDLIGNPNVPGQTTITVPLKGFGGGPDIDVVPAGGLNFGRIAYFAGTGSFATRRLTVRNVGTQPTNLDPAANLKLGARGASKPYWRVMPLNAESLPSEICIGDFDTTNGTCRNDLATVGMGAYDPSIGIEASVSRGSLDIPVRITPSNTTVNTTTGVKAWSVTFFSNDPDEPEVTVNITARPVLLPPCNYSYSPLTLGYGVVTPPQSKDRSFQICNLSPASDPTKICLLSGLDLEAGTDQIFSLPAGAVNERELAPQECLTVPTRAWPRGMLPPNPAGVTGGVTFNISDPNRPVGRVQLTATLAPSCLVISPSALDFGTVKKGCNSPSRTFQVYNACAQPLRWVDSELESAAGVPAGTPGCAGPGRCDEFKVTTAPSTASLPTTGALCTGATPGPGGCLAQGATPVTFQLRYSPLDLGADTGAYRIKVLQSGQPVDYYATLTGAGDNDGNNIDTFRQDARPKADILLVIDNSCSMNDKQLELGRNFSSFIRFATTSQVDFQMGITTTDFDDEGMCPGCITGSLKAAPVTGTKIFTPSTPDLERQFAATVNVGTSGGFVESCMAPAVRALTAPKITDPATNAGLLRPDAVLAVVCVTDAPDQATQPVSFYLNQLQNIKGVQRPGQFSYNVIGPFLPSPPTSGQCVYDGQGDDGKHVQMVSQTNGVREEICTPNWATALERIGRNAFGFRTSFYLTGTPDLTGMNPITVRIDGMVLPPVDARGNEAWRYDAATNSIVFQPLYVPEPGKTMTVAYKVACL